MGVSSGDIFAKRNKDGSRGWMDGFNHKSSNVDRHTIPHLIYAFLQINPHPTPHHTTTTTPSLLPPRKHYVPHETNAPFAITCPTHHATPPKKSAKSQVETTTPFDLYKLLHPVNLSNIPSLANETDHTHTHASF